MQHPLMSYHGGQRPPASLYVIPIPQSSDKSGFTAEQ